MWIEDRGQEGWLNKQIKLSRKKLRYFLNLLSAWTIGYLGI